MKRTEEPAGAQAIQRALRILECFTVATPVHSLSSVCQLTGLSMPTTHRIMRALQARGFLVHDSAGGHYGLGPAIARMSQVMSRRSDDLVNLAMPHLGPLRDLTAETVGIHVPVGSFRLCVAELVGPQPIRMSSGVGQTYPLYAGAAGRVMLAFQTDADLGALQEFSEPPTPESNFSPTRLRKLLAEVRARGYAISHGETVAGASALAVPIRDSERVVACLNLTGPTYRLTQAEMMRHLPAMLDAAHEVSSQLGHDAEVLRRETSPV